MQRHADDALGLVGDALGRIAQRLVDADAAVATVLGRDQPEEGGQPTEKKAIIYIANSGKHVSNCNPDQRKTNDQRNPPDWLLHKAIPSH
jgi:hypothetical protein